MPHNGTPAYTRVTKEFVVSVPDPYARSTFHGKPLDNATIAALKIAEERLGYELTILQGIGGAAASAGTHLEGRAVDLAPYDHERKVRVLRDLGFAVWHRPTLPGVWGEHVHGILIFENRTNSRGLADSGFRQIASYDRGRDGLKGDGVDPNPYRPNPRAVFTRAEYAATFAKPAAPAPVKAPQPAAKGELDVWFYNLDNGRKLATVQAEVEAILSTKPAILGASEATGYRFKPIPGYVLVSDGSRKSRANIVAWVRADLTTKRPFRRWLDLTMSWPRTKFSGTHEPRSFLRTRIGRVRVFVVHQPPPNLGALTTKGQREGISRLRRAIAPRFWPLRPVVVVGDMNARAGQSGPGPSLLAEQVKGSVVGGRIDCAVVRNMQAAQVAYPTKVAGVALGSDHGHAFRARLSVDKKWLPANKEK